MIVSCIEIFGLLFLHVVLIHYLAANNVMSVIFAAGEHVPGTTLLLAGFFLLVRIMVALALPGMILARIGHVLFDYYVVRRKLQERE